MIAIAENVQVVAKENGTWPEKNGRPAEDWFRLKINNEGELTHLDCSREQFNYVQMFKPYDMVLELGERGFSITARLNDVKDV